MEQVPEVSPEHNGLFLQSTWIEHLNPWLNSSWTCIWVAFAKLTNIKCVLVCLRQLKYNSKCPWLSCITGLTLITFDLLFMTLSFTSLESHLTRYTWKESEQKENVMFFWANDQKRRKKIVLDVTLHLENTPLVGQICWRWI